MDKLLQLQNTLDGYLAQPSVCLWYSGGSDSRLLLEMMVESGKPFGVIRFDDGWTKEQKSQVDAVIMKHNLQAFSYPALQNLLVGDGENIALASTFAVDSKGNTVLLVRDVVDDPDRPVAGIQLEKPRTLAAPIEFKWNVWGSRFEDRHFICGDKPLINSLDRLVGDKIFNYPLAEWTREEVTRELLRRGIDLSNDLDLDIHASHESLREYDFNPSANLELVRTALAV